MVLKASWVSRQKVEMERRIKKSEPNATYCRERERERERERSVTSRISNIHRVFSLRQHYSKL